MMNNPFVFVAVYLGFHMALLAGGFLVLLAVAVACRRVVALTTI